MKTVFVFLFLGVSIIAAPKKLLVLGQKPDGHPPGTHEYMPGARIVKALMAEHEEVKVTISQADEPWVDGPKLIAEADGIVMFLDEGGRFVQEPPKRKKALQAFAKRGGGLVVYHWGMGARDAKLIAPFLELFGGCHGGPDRKYTVVKDAQFQVAAPKHPVMAGIKSFELPFEEFYYKLKVPQLPKNWTALVKVPIEGSTETVGWAWERPGGGRSVGYSGLHFHVNWRHEQYQRLIAQAVLWTLKESIPQGGVKLKLDSKVIELPGR
ncbi:MAG: ThuA domain-containing protein [Verrucomicrobiota bacterium]|jgi:type 1 glutamine amidotransferase|nr:ThuA domain-containing protein [Verrucomicrobiota bacterium]